MTDDELLRRAFRTIEVAADFGEATLVLEDTSRLVFCHRVGKRTAQAVGGDPSTSQANVVLARILRFRLNGKHLDVEFADGSRWELLFDQRPTGTEPSK